MSEKKNIDRLFQEKFKDFEAAPPERAWQNIEAELKKVEKERKVIPLWLRLSGVAAILIIGLLLTLPLINTNPDSGINPMVIEENQEASPGTDTNAMPDSSIPAPVDEAVTEASGKTSDAEALPKSNGMLKIYEDANSGMVYQGSGNKNEDNIPATNKEGGNNNTSDRIIQNANEGIAVNNGEHSNDTDINSSDEEKFDTQNSENSVVQQNTVQDNIPANDGDNNNNVLTPQEKDRILQRTLERTRITQLTVTEESDKPEDTVVAEQENELEKLLKEKEEGKEDKAIAEAGKPQKWNIRPQVAPVFFNSLSEGSPIDAQFASNSKSFDTDMSYGVGIDYAVNDRLSVRTAVNTLKMGYSTNGVEFFPSMTAQTNNVSTPGRAANIVVQNQTGEANSVSLFGDNTFANQKFFGSMVQEMGYIEVPVEMSYRLLNKKFGIELIGGVSTLFLNENNVFAISDQGYSTEVGEATNVNNINFSTNVGVGFRYRFWKSFEANFDPMFKYQVNTFSGESGNFRPYIIGLYSGVSFKF